MALPLRIQTPGPPATIDNEMSSSTLDTVTEGRLPQPVGGSLHKHQHTLQGQARDLAELGSVSRNSSLAVSLHDTKEPPGKSLSEHGPVLRLLNAGDDTVLYDIVFVHGPGGQATWQARSSGVFWPRDLLPKTFPHARVFSYEYDFSAFLHTENPSNEKIADNLLFKLALRRAHDMVFSRPLVWVSHSLGGLLVKSCLARSRAKARIDPLLSSISTSTTGIIFLGTPHHAHTTLGWTNIFGKVRSLVEPKLLAQNENDSSKSLLIAKASKPQIANILDLLRRFDAILDESGIMIWSFYERQATLIGDAPTFVTQTENALHHPMERLQLLHGDHITMCKFENQLETGYVAISSALASILERALDYGSEYQRSLQGLTIRVPETGDQSPTVRSGSENPSDSLATTNYLQSKKLEAVKTLLFTSNPTRTHLPERTFGSCSWVLKNPTFQDWLGDTALLKITGPVGCGKSILASYIVDHLQDTINSDDEGVLPHSTLLLHFFYVQTERGKPNEEMLRQFLLQILEINPHLIRHFPDSSLRKSLRKNVPMSSWPGEEDSQLQLLATKFDVHRYAASSVPPHHRSLSVGKQDSLPFSHMAANDRLRGQDLVDIMLSMLRDPDVKKLYFIIDGIDEWHHTSLSSLRQILSTVSNIKGTKICLSHRYGQQIDFRICINNLSSCTLDLSPPLHGSVIASDMNLFQKAQLGALTRQQRLPASKIGELDNVVSQSTSYLWMFLIFRVVSQLPTIGSINSFLSQVSNSKSCDGVSLEGMCDWILQYIFREYDNSVTFALFFVLLANRPIKLAVLANHVVAISTLRADQTRRHVRSFTDLMSEPLHDFNAFSSLEELENSRRLDLRQWLERESFGLESFGILQVRSEIVSVMHSEIRKTLLKLAKQQTALVPKIQRDIAASCITLLSLPHRAGYSLNPEDLDNPVWEDILDYSLVHWSSHVKDAGKFAKELQNPIEELHKQELLPTVLLQKASKVYQHQQRPSLSCFLAAFDLSENLSSVQTSEPKPGYLSLEIRYALANSANDVVRYLRTKGHDTTGLDESGWKAEIYAACARGADTGDQRTALDYLHGRRRNLTYTTHILPSPRSRILTFELLYTAISNDDIQLLEKAPQTAFLEAGSRREEIERLLELAADRQNTWSVQFLLDKFQVFAKDMRLGGALRHAAKRANLEISSLLLKNGADCNDQKGDDPSALHFGASTGRLELVKLLLENGAGKSAVDKRGRKPVHWAAKSGHSKIVECLISHATDVDRHGKTTLFLACRSASLPTIRILLEYGVSVNKGDYRDRTPLHAAAAAGFLDVVKLLLIEGAKPNVRTKSGTTPLHEAALGGWSPLAQELIGAGADVRACDQFGRTTLHLACGSRNPSNGLAKDLLKLNVSPYARDTSGKTSLHYAAQSGDASIVTLLVDAGGLLTLEGMRDNDGMTPLHYAARSGRTPIARCLLDSIPTVESGDPHTSLQIWVDAKDSRGRSPLLYAAAEAPLKLFEALLKHSSEFRHLDEDSNSILHLIFGSKKDVQMKARSLKSIQGFSLEFFLEVKNRNGESFTDVAHKAGNDTALREFGL